MTKKTKVVGAVTLGSLVVLPGAVMAEDESGIAPAVEIETQEGPEIINLDDEVRFYGGVCDFDEEKLTEEELQKIEELEDRLDDLYEKVEEVYEENEETFEALDEEFFEAVEAVEDALFYGQDIDFEKYEEQIKAIEKELGLEGIYEEIGDLQEQLAVFEEKAYECSYSYADGFDELSEEEQERVEELEEELEELYEEIEEKEEELYAILGEDYFYYDDYDYDYDYYEDEWEEGDWEDDYEYEYEEDGIFVTEEDLKDYERKARSIYLENQDEFNKIDAEYDEKLKALEEVEEKRFELEEKTGLAKLWDDFWGSFY